jgi:hypothetical protein
MPSISRYFAVTFPFRIGIDFDNTIITYDDVFCTAAKSHGFVDMAFVGGKQAVRDAIRLLPEGELIWQRLQGQVYGKGIGEAGMVDGFDAFLRRCRIECCEVAIVSHKTKFGHYDPDRVDLRKAALGWMAARRLFDGDHGIELDDVYFENTREEKLRRIAALGLTHFIDDLEEVLTDPGFPPNVKRILFADDGRPGAQYVACRTWRDIEERVFERA